MEVSTSELDLIMKPYIDSGNYTKEELEKMRKLEYNKLRENTRETSWWKGEEGWIPDELQPGVSRPRVSKEVEEKKEETRTTPPHVSEAKVDDKVPHITTGGRFSDRQIYSKHEGLEDALSEVDSFRDEEDVVPVLNKFYKVYLKFRFLSNIN